MPMHHAHITPLQKKQQGAVLVVGLMLLLAMVMLIMAGSTNSLIAAKLAGNTSAKDASFQAANAALEVAITTCLGSARANPNQSVSCQLPVSFIQSLPNGSTVVATITAIPTQVAGTSLSNSGIQIFRVHVETDATVNGATTKLAMGVLKVL